MSGSTARPPKFLFLNFAAHGHVNPTLAIISELTADGAEVTYVLPESFREAVESAGATLAPLPVLEHGRQPAITDDQLAALPFNLAAQAPQMVPPIVELIGQIQPDCVVYNALYLWGRLAALFTDTPAAAFRPFHAPRAHRSVAPPYASPEIRPLAIAGAEALATLCRAYAKPALSLSELVGMTEPLTLVFVPAAFQHGVEAFDGSFLFTGPCLPVLRPGQNFFQQDPLNLTRNVYISLGTMRNDDPEFYRLCMEAFPSNDWTPVLSIGRKTDPASLGPIPANFTVAAHVPQLAVLAEADVFITHGGLNSVMEALFYGVPMVVMPGTREQKLTARRVRDLGLGLILERENLSAETLRQLARQVATDRDVLRNMREMRQITRQSGGAPLAAQALWDFVMK